MFEPNVWLCPADGWLRRLGDDILPPQQHTNRLTLAAHEPIAQIPEDKVRAAEVEAVD